MFLIEAKSFYFLNFSPLVSTVLANSLDFLSIAILVERLFISQHLSLSDNILDVFCQVQSTLECLTCILIILPAVILTYLIDFPKRFALILTTSIGQVTDKEWRLPVNVHVDLIHTSWLVGYSYFPTAPLPSFFKPMFLNRPATAIVHTLGVLDAVGGHGSHVCGE